MAADSEDLVILACTVLTVTECDKQTDRATDTHSKTDASTTAKMREALHTVVREKSCAVFKFRSLRLARMYCRSLTGNTSLALALAYRSATHNMSPLGRHIFSRYFILFSGKS